MPHHLLSLANGPSILIDKPILLFGRHEECDIQLHSKKVSRLHCILVQVNEQLFVRDLGSTNGVRINGERVTEGKLSPGDEVHIGTFKYLLCDDPIGRSQQESRSEEYQSVPHTEQGEESEAELKDEVEEKPESEE